MAGQVQQIEGSALDYLKFVDQLIVRQKMDIFEVTTRTNLPNSYYIQNNLGQIAFDAIEEYDTTRMGFFVGPGYVDMNIYITDFLQREAIFMYRTVRCNCCCLICRIKEGTRVESPRGTVLGYIVASYLCRPKYTIENASGAKLFTVKAYGSGPIAFAREVHFDVLTPNNVRTARISKLLMLTGARRDNTFTNPNYLRVAFPMNMDLNAKALILSTAVTIYTHFEYKPPVRHHHYGHHHHHDSYDY